MRILMIYFLYLLLYHYLSSKFISIFISIFIYMKERIIISNYNFLKK